MSGTAATGAASAAGGGPSAPRSLAEVRAAMHAVALWCPDEAATVTGAVAADLMSDVLVGARPGYVLVTGLVNLQVVRTAAISDLAAVVFASGKAVPADLVDLARQMQVPVLATRDTLFEAAGRLYALLGGGEAEPGARRQA
ncbi:MAG: hypothetical protein ACM3H9_09790 [Rhodospirillaceae bacterium]